MTSFPISEIFGPTIQGEGIFAGKRTYFIRFAGCDTKCAWCDTKHSWNAAGAEQVSEREILVRAHNREAAPIVTLTGGNPALYDLARLVHFLKDNFKEIHVETQGTIWQDWFRSVDFMSVSPKLHHLKEDVLKKIFDRGKAQMKVVVFSDKEYEMAKRLHTLFPSVPLILQVGFSDQMRDMAWLPELASADKDLVGDVRVLPQIHRVFWGNKQGV